MPLGGPTSAIRWVEIEPAYVFHGVNAFRDGDDVVRRRVPARRSVRRTGPTLGPPPTLHRWRIDTAGPSLTFRDDVLSDRTGRPAEHRPAPRPGATTATAGASRSRPAPTPSRCAASSTTTCSPARSSGTTRPSRSSGEWLFVPRGEQEGEGFLVTYVYDATTDASELVILDAQDVGAGPLAEVSLPATRAVRLPRDAGYRRRPCKAPGVRSIRGRYRDHHRSVHRREGSCVRRCLPGAVHLRVRPGEQRAVLGGGGRERSRSRTATRRTPTRSRSSATASCT